MPTAAPETIGPYRLVSKLGQGGMGTVFRAVHGTLERPVALKVLSTEFAANPEYVSRFLREARSIAALGHENIVAVYDAGEHDHRYFIAMELIDGTNLLKYIEEHAQRSEADCLALLRQAACGLAAAHAQGLTHRDIKPENLLLGRDGVLRIADFGLVMEAASNTQLTATGAYLGTPMYMSPEQTDGEEADARTDIYSLGVTFYRVFTGETPFSSPTVMNLLFKHKFEAPPDPRQIRRDLSEDVAHLLLRMIAKPRKDRPQSAQALVDLIDGLKRGEHIPPPVPYISPALSGVARAPHQPLPGHWKLRILAVLGLATGVGALVWAIFFSNPEIVQPAAPAPTPHVPGEVDGDAAAEAGRLNDALEIYRATSAREPGNEGLRKKITQAQRKTNFLELMRLGQEAEAQNELETAQGRYAGAIIFDEGHAAQQQYDRIKGILEAKLHPVIIPPKPVPPVDNSLPYQVAMTAGQQALEKQDFDTARVKFGVAMGLQPALTAPAEKIKEIEAREALLEGDTLRDKGDLAAAIQAYVRVAAKWPVVAAEAQTRLTAVRKQMPVPEDITASVEKWVRAEKDSEALSEAGSALAKDKNNATLKNLNLALESLKTCNGIYNELQKEVATGQAHLLEAKQLDDDDETKERNTKFGALLTSYAERAKLARPQFLDRNYDEVQKTLASAHADASDLVTELAQTADLYEKKSEKATEKANAKGPLGLGIGVSSNKKKAEKYHNLAGIFKDLAEQAKALK